jgi:hypothetical protein
MIALQARYANACLTYETTEETTGELPNEVVTNGRVDRAVSSVSLGIKPPSVGLLHARERRSKTCSSITERTVQALLKGRNSGYFNLDEDNYTTTSAYDIGKIRPLVKRDKRVVPTYKATRSYRQSRDTSSSTLCSSMESDSREEIDESGPGERLSRFKSVIAKLKRPFGNRFSIRRFRKKRSTSQELVQTSTPVKEKKSHSFPSLDNTRESVDCDGADTSLPCNRPRMPSPTQQSRTFNSVSSQGGEGIYSSLNSTSSESLIESDTELSDPVNVPPPIPPRPKQTGNNEAAKAKENVLARPVSVTYASIEDMELSPRPHRPPPRPPTSESIPETIATVPPTPPPRLPKRSSSPPPPLPERRRLVTLTSNVNSNLPPPLPKRNGCEDVSQDNEMTPFEIRPRAASMPASILRHTSQSSHQRGPQRTAVSQQPDSSPTAVPHQLVSPPIAVPQQPDLPPIDVPQPDLDLALTHVPQQPDSPPTGGPSQADLPPRDVPQHPYSPPTDVPCQQADIAVTDSVPESDYLVPIEEIQKMSGKPVQPTTPENCVADSPQPPPRTRDSFNRMSVHQAQFQVESLLVGRSEDTMMQGSDSAPVTEVMSPTDDEDVHEVPSGLSYTTDDLPSPGGSLGIEGFRRSHSESLLDNLVDSDVPDHYNSVDELDDSHPINDLIKSLQKSIQDSTKRRFEEDQVVDDTNHSDMPDETRMRSNTVSRMRASVRKTRDKLVSHSHGVRHSVVERQRLATLVLLSDTDPGDGKDVSAEERARRTILHSGPKLLALRKSRTPSRKIGGHISKMAASRNSKLGFNIDKFVVQIKDGTHSDPIQLLSEIRNFMNQLKTYLLTDKESELASVLAKEVYTQDVNLDAVVEGVLVKAVIRPLQKTIQRCFTACYGRSGSLQMLTDNLQLASQKTPVQLGVKDDLIPPQGPSLDHIRGKINKMQASHSPLCKLEHLLAAVDIIYQSVKNSKTEVGGEDLVLGADDFLPIFIYVLAQIQFHHAEIESEYMWGLLDPSLLTGEGGYYLTTLSSAVMVIKQIHETDASSGRKKRVPRLPRIGDLQGYMRVQLPSEEDVNMTVFKTLPIDPSMTVQDACCLIAQKLKMNNFENYTLYKVIDQTESILDDDFRPQHLKMEWVLSDLEAEGEGRTPVERYFVFKRKPFTDL